ncbi:MAG: D-alanyl-D-alanine carboxypeptidase/D-alanyl-D-alanine-endopeptidase [Burkholderiaceae bacterium]
MAWVRWIGLVLSVVWVAGAAAQPRAARLPEAVVTQLRVAKIPPAALGAMLVPLTGPGLELRHNETQLLNPASTMKLVTTLAGLELLGPQFTWRTEVLAESVPRAGALEGDLFIRGSGDPAFVIENLWLLAQRLRGAGIREIRGDLVLDRSAFEAVAHDPAAFDGEALRPYNAGPDALLLNYKTISLNFIPEPDGKTARVYAMPQVAGLVLPAHVRVEAGPCSDWRARLGGDFTDPLRPQFRGAYPLACGERAWHLNLLEPTRYFEMVFRSLWEAGGGTLTGRVRDGAPSPSARVLAVQESRPLAEVIRDINKFSNNVMARQLFLSLAVNGDKSPATTARAQAVVADWLGGKGIGANEFVLDNGSGLSRVERISPRALARLLVAAYVSPWMPEFMSSMPIVGVDGTMKKRNGAVGSAHIKTGLLADSRAIAGYVLASSGRRYAVVAIVNHANAGAATPALDALLNWIYING